MASVPSHLSSIGYRGDSGSIINELKLERPVSVVYSENTTSSNHMIPHLAYHGSAANTFIKPDMNFESSHQTFNCVKSLLLSFVFGTRGRLTVPLEAVKTKWISPLSPRQGATFAPGRQNRFFAFLRGPFIRRMLYLLLICTLLVYLFLLVIIYPPHTAQPSNSSLGPVRGQSAETVASKNADNIAHSPALGSYNMRLAESMPYQHNVSVASSISPHFSPVCCKQEISFFALKSDDEKLRILHDALFSRHSHPNNSPLVLFTKLICAQVATFITSYRTVDILYLVEQIKKVFCRTFSRFSYFSSSATPSSCGFLATFSDWYEAFWEDPDDPEDPPFEAVFFLPVIGRVKISFETAGLDSLLIDNPLKNNFGATVEEETCRLFSISNISASVIINVNLSTRFFERSVASIKCHVANASLSLVRPTASSFPLFDTIIPVLEMQSLAKFDASKAILNALLGKYQNIFIQRTQRHLDRRLNRSLRVATKKVSQLMSLGYILEVLVDNVFRHPLRFLILNIRSFING